MKIESKIINQTVNFFNKDITFDKFGKAEIEDEFFAASIIESFGDLVWEEGKQVIKQVNKAKDDSEEVLKLKDEINRLEGVNSGLKIQLVQAKEQEKVWRDECAKYELLIKEGSLLKEGVVKNQDEIVIPEGYDEVYKEMQEKNLESLKEMCKSDLGVSAETLIEFKGKNGKEKLIKYIFENVIK